MTNPVPTATDKRLLWIVVGALLLAAVALWASSGLAWIDVPRGLTRNGRLADDVTGGQSLTALTPLALFALAAIAATLATGGWLRRVFGVLVLAVAAWALYAVLDAALNGMGRISWSGWAPGYGDGPGEPARTLLGPAVAVAGVVLLGCAGAVLAWRGRLLPRMGARYSAPGGRREREQSRPDLWQALSDGDDPTTRS
ncbi:putative membrane protein (TIGR02234 family) [Saccharomonospora amisosensis]|uniref:Putative membrane protein (TIGR02234 family) n=1 Tax=Saccharomonospora amisosensis TaxID=1128677 RepID=A0A7X5UN96_9PSEU|nr:Trp biosynthesis-associated membrane protein [Saccharomonospora amisosensis]NIJ11151.1 putative membrane protein (TIGR02234 family) [Saccharomonospora amisosensis]